MKTKNLFYLCLVWLIMLFIGLRTLCAGDVSPGAAPGSINYQGRLEKDNAPVTGLVHLRFRIFDVLDTGECPGVHCLWESPEITVTITQGIFGASLTPPWEVLSTAGSKYLEVQVEDQVLSPRERLRSVMYSMISKRVEDGAVLVVSTLTSTYGVLLAMESGNVGIGIEPQSTNKLEVAGHIKITGTGHGIYFWDGSFMDKTGAVSVAGVSANADVIIQSDADGPHAGDDIIFETTSIERMRLLTTNGNLGIGTANPSQRLEVNGYLSNTSGNFGVFFTDKFVMRPSTDSVSTEGIFRVLPKFNALGGAGGASIETYFMTDISGFSGFSGDPVNYSRGRMRMTTTDLEFVSESGGLGTDHPILFKIGGSDVVRIETDGDVGIGTGSPGAQLHVVSDGASAIGIMSDNVLIGGWGHLNEIRSTGDLIMQYPGNNVGIGTVSPANKLHVNGSIRSNFGIIAATGAFSGKVSVNGNFIALSGSDRVKLSSTTIYGTLIVTGGIGGEAGFPAYLDEGNIFTAPLNKFENSVLVDDRLGAGTAGHGFMEDHLSGSNYLQVGAGDAAGAEGDDAIVYLASGDNANVNAILSFYRGDSEASRIQTSNGANLFFVTNALTRAVITSAGRLGIGTESPSELLHVQGGGVRISTAAGGLSIYVNPVTGNVGIGTDNLATTDKLTVAGDIRLSTATYGIIFPDGSFMASAGSGTYTGVSNNADAIIRGDADSSGQGDVILKVGSWSGVVVKAGGKVGIGTIIPESILHIKGGDVLIGDPGNTHIDSSDDLVVGGNVYVEGVLKVASITPDMLDVTGHAFSVGVSTLVTAYGQVGIGTTAPTGKLHVEKIGDVATTGLVQILQPEMVTDGREVSLAIGKALSAGDSGLLGYRYDTAAADKGMYLLNYGDTLATASLFLQKGGNVGIGTITPGVYKLYVNSGNLYVGGNIVLSGTVDGKDIATYAAMLNEDESITANWVNTINPWADNEVSNTLTINGGSVADSVLSPNVTKLGGSIESSEITSVSSLILTDGGTISFDWVDAEVSNTLTITGGSVADSVLSPNVTKLGGSISSAEVTFNYAGSGSKGGAANNLSCTNCVADSEVASSGNWNTAYSERRQWDGGGGNLNALNGRNNLQLGSGLTGTQKVCGNCEITCVNGIITGFANCPGTCP